MRKKLSCVIVLSLVGLLLSGCGIDADYLNELGFAISDDGKLVSENTDDADGSAEENNSQNVSEKNSESDLDGKSEKIQTEILEKNRLTLTLQSRIL